MPGSSWPSAYQSQGLRNSLPDEKKSERACTGTEATRKNVGAQDVCVGRRPRRILILCSQAGTTQSCGMSGIVELETRHRKGRGEREGVADKKREYTGCTPVR